MATFTPHSSTRHAITKSYKNGLIRANDPGIIYAGRTARQDGVSERGIVFCHGAGVDGNFLIESAVNGPQVFQPIFDAGFVMVATQRDAGGSIGVNTWGNDTARTWLSADRVFLQTAPGSTGMAGGGAYTGKVAIFGFSMGGIEAFNLAKAIGPANVVGIVTFEGATDMSWHRGTDTSQPAGAGGDWSGAFYASINTAYTVDSHNPDSGTSPTDADWAVIAAEHDPMLFAATSADVPLLAYVNDDDVLIGGDLSPSKTQQLANQLTHATVRTFATGGHTLLNPVPIEIISWLNTLNW